LKRVSSCIQCGITRWVIRIDERNMRGSPTKFEAAIIVASRRASSAMPCETPETTIDTSAATTNRTTTPATRPCTPTLRPTRRRG
jgi:hypothetical protein